MLYMVIERFKNGDARAVGERFKLRGRMLPDGVTYHASWVDVAGTCCYQIMESAELELLKAWMSCWDDLVEFEVVQVTTSADFWSAK